MEQGRHILLNYQNVIVVENLLGPLTNIFYTIVLSSIISEPAIGPSGPQKAVVISQDYERKYEENINIPRLGSLHIPLSFLGQRVPLGQQTSQ